MYIVCIAHEYLERPYYTAFCEIFMSFSFHPKNPTGEPTHTHTPAYMYMVACVRTRTHARTRYPTNFARAEII